jgi:hypothetical protein
MRAAPRHAAWAVGFWVVSAIASTAAVSAQIIFTEAGGSILAGQSISDSASTTIDTSGQVALPDAPDIATMRVAWNVNADASPGLVAVEVGLLSYTVGFVLEHPASFNLRLDFNLAGGLLRIADQAGCVGAVTQADIAIPTLERLGGRAQEFPIGIVLAGETIDTAGSTAGASVSRQASARLLFRDEPVDTTSYRLQFLVSVTAISQSCEVSARFGAQNGSTTGCDACVYPGPVERTQKLDGLFITAIVENLCGNATLDPGETCDLGETNGAAGTCCDRFCRAAAPGSACGDDGAFCTADLCTAGGTCSHPLVAGATCDDTTCICDNDDLFCNGKAQCGRNGGLCIALPAPCAEDDTCDETNDVCLTPFGTATPTVDTPTATPTVDTPTATPTATPGAPTPTSTSGPLLTPTATAVAAACTGDCNGDGTVAINELVLGVSVALTLQPASACPAFDANRDGSVVINEVVAAVNNTLAGCP